LICQVKFAKKIIIKLIVLKELDQKSNPYKTMPLVSDNSAPLECVKLYPRHGHTLSAA